MFACSYLSQSQIELQKKFGWLYLVEHQESISG